MSLKTIKATVGAVGANIAADVATVQYLLNCIPYSQGGPPQELDVDGIVSVSTIQAIKRFQQFHFGQSSGQIAANDLTLNKLKIYDPLPSKAWVVPPGFKPSPDNKSYSGGKISHEGIKGRTGNISAIDTHMKRQMGNISYSDFTIKGKTGR